jgi:hypothetical protein
MVSPKPLSDFVPVVTLIAFPISIASAAGWQHILLARIARRFAPRKWSILV